MMNAECERLVFEERNRMVSRRERAFMLMGHIQNNFVTINTMRQLIATAGPTAKEEVLEALELVAQICEARIAMLRKELRAL